MAPPPGPPNHRPSVALKAVSSLRLRGARGKKRGAESNFLAHGFDGRPASRKLTLTSFLHDPLFFSAERSQARRAPPLLVPRQVVPGRADLWGGGAARAWAL